MVSRRTCALVALACVSGSYAGLIQNPLILMPWDAAKHRKDVKDIFLTSWNAYKQVAFPHDDLAPVSMSFVDGRNGWGATAVDSLSTLWIMGEHKIFDEIVDFTTKLDFTKPVVPGTASVFETTIRYLGGILSAYELSGKKNKALLKQAEVLGLKMSKAWINGNKVPFGHLDFVTEQPRIDTTNIAEAGTLSLEWNRLALHTGNDTFRELAEGSVRQVASQNTPIPGFPAQGIDPATGKPVGAYVTWGGGSDSYIEYLIKYARLTNTDDNMFADTWATAVDSSIKTLLRTSTVGDHVYFADQDDQGRIRHVSSNLACFHAGNLIMGSRLLNNQTIFNLALKLNDGCWNTYASTATGIGPDSFAFFSKDGNYTGSNPSEADIAFYNKHGFFPRSTYYYMRPEVLESNFYAWRATGDWKYYNRAVDAVKSFNTFLKTKTNPPAYAPLNDVNNPDAGFIDDMESFWFAEVLKYLYLTFDDPYKWSLDKYVFNTEAHPFIAPPPKLRYGSGKHHWPFGPFTKTEGNVPAVSAAPKIQAKGPGEA